MFFIFLKKAITRIIIESVKVKNPIFVWEFLGTRKTKLKQGIHELVEIQLMEFFDFKDLLFVKYIEEEGGIFGLSGLEWFQAVANNVEIKLAMS